MWIKRQQGKAQSLFHEEYQMYSLAAPDCLKGRKEYKDDFDFVSYWLPTLVHGTLQPESSSFMILLETTWR
jgi:hypothetical protein